MFLQLVNKWNKTHQMLESRVPPNYLFGIFSHLKLWIASARHNLKWVTIIEIWQNEGQWFWNEPWTWWKDREVRHKLSSTDEPLTNKSTFLTSAVAMLSCEGFGIYSNIILFTKNKFIYGYIAYIYLPRETWQCRKVAKRIKDSLIILID